MKPWIVTISLILLLGLAPAIVAAALDSLVIFGAVLLLGIVSVVAIALGIVNERPEQ
jgi:hypothetical protein